MTRTFTVRVSAEALDELRDLTARAGLAPMSDVGTVMYCLGIGIEHERRTLKMIAEYAEGPTR